MAPHGLEPGSYQLLIYDYVNDIMERRGPHRGDHLAHAELAQSRGDLLNVGAVGSPPTGAIFVFSGDVPDSAILEYARQDPYTAAGLVPEYRVEAWTVVV